MPGPLSANPTSAPPQVQPDQSQKGVLFPSLGDNPPPTELATRQGQFADLAKQSTTPTASMYGDSGPPPAAALVGMVMKMQGDASQAYMNFQDKLKGAEQQHEADWKADPKAQLARDMAWSVAHKASPIPEVANMAQKLGDDINTIMTRGTYLDPNSGKEEVVDGHLAKIWAYANQEEEGKQTADYPRTLDLQTKRIKQEADEQRTTAQLILKQQQQGDINEIHTPNGGTYPISKYDYRTGNHPGGPNSATGGGAGGASGGAGLPSAQTGTAGAGAAPTNAVATGAAGTPAASETAAPAGTPAGGPPAIKVASNIPFGYKPPQAELDQANQIENEYNQAQPVQVRLGKMSDTVKDISPGSFLAQKNDLLSSFVSNLEMIGVPVSDGIKDMVSSGQELGKVAEQLKVAAAKQLGSNPAGFIVDSMIKQIPNAMLSPDGFQKVLADFKAFNQYAIDRKLLMDKYKEEHQGYLSDPFHPAENFNAYAAKTLDPQAYTTWSKPGKLTTSMFKLNEDGSILRDKNGDGALNEEGFAKVAKPGVVYDGGIRINPVTGKPEKVF